MRTRTAAFSIPSRGATGMRNRYREAFSRSAAQRGAAAGFLRTSRSTITRSRTTSPGRATAAAVGVDAERRAHRRHATGRHRIASSSTSRAMRRAVLCGRRTRCAKSLAAARAPRELWYELRSGEELAVPGVHHGHAVGKRRAHANGARAMRVSAAHDSAGLKSVACSSRRPRRPEVHLLRLGDRAARDHSHGQATVDARGWLAGYPERARGDRRAFIVQQRCSGVVFVSGDLHLSPRRRCELLDAAEARRRRHGAADRFFRHSMLRCRSSTRAVPTSASGESTIAAAPVNSTMQLRAATADRLRPRISSRSTRNAPDGGAWRISATAYGPGRRA